MAYTPVTVADFKAYFTRDFPYGADNQHVTDADITKAEALAGINFNEALWESQAIFTQAFLLLSAHYLVENLRASGGGLNGQYAGNTINKSVGNVSEGYQIPERVGKSPFLSGLYTTRYGAQYVGLISLRLIGNVATIRGATTP
jgi:hypothetical protein